MMFVAASFFSYFLAGKLFHCGCIVTVDSSVADQNTISDQNPVTNKNAVTDQYAVSNEHPVTDQATGCEERRTASVRSAVTRHHVRIERQSGRKVVVRIERSDMIADQYTITDKYAIAIADQNSVTQGTLEVVGGLILRDQRL